MAIAGTIGESRLALTLVVLALAAALTAPPAGSVARGDRVDASDRLIEELIALVRENYVLEERVATIEKRLRDGLESGDYRRLSDRAELAARLTRDLREASGDLHFGVRPRPDGGDRGSADRGTPPPDAALGIGRVEILEGAVGYLEILAFPEPERGAAAADAAFAELAGTVALIIDVRASRGGHPGMVAYLLSYLLDRAPFVFNRFHLRTTDETHEFWTRSDLPSPRYADRPVYVLTSHRTPSAAEGFGYHLKHLGRAVVVGERTAGAAHISRAFPLLDLQIAIPYGRPISPVTGTNWEGRGVQPDHEVPAQAALSEALRLAGMEAALQDPSSP